MCKTHDMKIEEIKSILKPETELEKRIISTPEFIEGAAYGKPRPGHPEGQVVYHIREVLNNVDKYSTPENRSDLRIIALIHDTFKYKVDNTKPKVGMNHHALIARRFAEQFVQIPEYVLDIIELHDEAYNAWQLGGRKGDWYKAEKRGNELLGKLQTDHRIDLYLAFYGCDNNTGDKEQENYYWFFMLDYQNRGKKDYDKFMAQYKLDHECCPECGSTEYSTTLVGYPMYSDDREAFKDLNSCVCSYCGDRHTRHDRVPKKIEV